MERFSGVGSETGIRFFFGERGIVFDLGSNACFFVSLLKRSLWGSFEKAALQDPRLPRSTKTNLSFLGSVF